MFAIRAEEKGLELRVNVSAAVPDRVIGDASRLRRVLVHLVDNAVKFTEGGRVSLSVEVVGDQLRFMVSDTGQGIVAEPGRDIFGDPLGSDAGFLRRHGGVGVGLSVCKKLVAAMGGRIAFETDPGRGSEFHFSIPLVSADGSVGEVEKTALPAEAIRLPRLAILLADGNPLSRRMVKAYLQFDGHDLTIVDNGLEAVEQARSGRYDLILLDQHLPKLDGIQTLRLIRDEEKATARARTPVVMLASAGGLRDADLPAGGIDGVVVKPVQAVELMAAAARATGVEPLAVARPEAPAAYAAEASGRSIRRLDATQLVSLRQVMAHDQFVGLLRFFMEDAVPGLLTLQALAGAAEPDAQRVAFAAAKVRGLAGYLGFRALAELLERLEHAGRTDAPPAELRRLAEELTPVTDDSLEELKRILPDAFITISDMTGPVRPGEGWRSETKMYF
ncbi:MAG: response regulator, partial [Planctomycetes bacterium]|nr:response regulator [Planctomycetota bacterium]